jgi:hypothetical protein
MHAQRTLRLSVEASCACLSAADLLLSKVITTVFALSSGASCSSLSPAGGIVDAAAALVFDN